MAKAPRFSVVIPAYKAVDYLAEAVESVFAQTLTDWELIIVNDGSPDATPELAEALAARRPERVRVIHKANGGPSSARNVGIRATRGHYIVFLDRDDRLHPDFLAICSHHAADDRAIYTGWRYIDEKGKKLPRIEVFQVLPERTLEELAYHNFIIITLVVPQDAYERYGFFDEDIPIHEDWDMWLRLAPHLTFIGVPHALVEYRIHTDNLTSDSRAMRESRRVVARKHFGPPEGDPAGWPPLKRRCYAGLSVNEAIESVREGAFDQAAAHLRRAGAILPEVKVNSDIFYEIACATQPRGERGVRDLLNMTEATRNVTEVIKGLNRRAQIAGHEALARLQSGADTRQQIAQIWRLEPRRLLDRKMWRMWLVSFTSRHLRQAIKRRLRQFA